MQALANYINGELVPPAGGQYLDNHDPSTGQAYSRVPDSDAADIEAAVVAAEAAFPKWSTTPAAERSRVLLRLAELIERDTEKLARAECIDNGKPLAIARAFEIPRAATNFRFFATAIVHERSDLFPMDRTALNYTLRRPRGVCGLISPWNLPLYLFTWKVAPAIAVGNTAVAKPSEVTPMTAFMLSELCREAGLPPGVLNIVHGPGNRTGAAIVTHPRIHTISFTGGTKTGRWIAERAAPHFKKVALELGGKNPTVVFADTAAAAIAGGPTFDEVIEQAVRAAFQNQGQICLCGSRILVERPIYDRFVERFVDRAAALRIGDPLDAGTDQGPVVSQPHREKIEAYIALARSEGGTIECGGGRPAGLPARCRDGYFIEPTVVTGLAPTCRVNQEEVFGPFVTILPFEDEADAVAIANGTEYGLAASLWTRDLPRAHRVADQLQSGTVWVNCWLLRDLRVPFGGMKNSGLGREGGEEALRFFSEPKTVCVKL